jgi:adenosyl cobinamide kinase/adenosyl cobinamide phosphate guanylyltransferase
MALVLLTGGARSGKSALAVQLASEQAAPVVFLATAQAGDEEMKTRIARHMRERPSSWRTIEEPLRLWEAIEAVDGDDCLLVDCLTMWTANALERFGVEETGARAAAAAGAAAARPGLTIAVTNEVGLGLVPDNSLGRSYRDLLGRVNAVWAAAADRALFLVAGRALDLEQVDSLAEGLR